MNKMRDRFKEEELLKTAVEAFREVTGVNVNIVVGGLEADALLQIRTQGFEEEFVVEVKRHLVARPQPVQNKSRHLILVNAS